MFHLITNLSNFISPRIIQKIFRSCHIWHRRREIWSLFCIERNVNSSYICRRFYLLLLRFISGQAVNYGVDLLFKFHIFTFQNVTALPTNLNCRLLSVVNEHVPPYNSEFNEDITARFLRTNLMLNYHLTINIVRIVVVLI